MCGRITKKMDLKFCPSCGGDTLLRTSTSTNGNGEVTVHLKKNMQWTNRGTKVNSLLSNIHRHFSYANGFSFRYRNQRGWVLPPHYLPHPPSFEAIKKNMSTQQNIARNAKKISWIQIICPRSCLMVLAVGTAGVSGLEDGVQDALVVGGDEVRMPFDDVKSILMKGVWRIIFIMC